MGSRRVEELEETGGSGTLSREERTDETKAVGRRIHEERVRAGFSRQRFADLMRWQPKQISRYEMGFKISDHRLGAIARELGLSYDYLKTGEGSRYPPDHPLRTPVPPELRDLLPEDPVLYEEAQQALAWRNKRADMKIDDIIHAIADQLNQAIREQDKEEAAEWARLLREVRGGEATVASRLVDLAELERVLRPIIEDAVRAALRRTRLEEVARDNPDGKASRAVE